MFTREEFMVKQIELAALTAEVIKNGNLPKHVAIIMDGNGRWAKKQGQLRVFGHQEGVTSAREAINLASELGLSYLTLYTFSKENWNRPAFEVTALMSLLVETITREISSLQEKNVRLKMIGRMEDLPINAKLTMEKAMQETAGNTGLTLVIALSYSGRDEILNAVNKLLAGSDKKTISEDEFSAQLYTSEMPDPELLIRTGGEYRLSNFLLWQMAYTELHITEKYWPDFGRMDFLSALKDYQTRERRFGKTSEQLINS